MWLAGQGWGSGRLPAHARALGGLPGTQFSHGPKSLATRWRDRRVAIVPSHYRPALRRPEIRGGSVVTWPGCRPPRERPSGILKGDAHGRAGPWQ